MKEIFSQVYRLTVTSHLKKIILLATFITMSFSLAWSQAILVKDINTLPAGQSSTEVCECAGYAYFTASNELGTELWRTNGTPDGTTMVKEILPGYGSGAGTSGFACINGILLFGASDGTHGFELWKSNGTIDGTVLLRDISEGSNGSSPRTFITRNGVLFFSAFNTQGITELWTSDGSTDGTSRVATVGTLPWSQQLLHVGQSASGIYFLKPIGSGMFELWVSDGTTNGTTILRSGTWLYEALGGGDKIYFAESVSNVQSLWVTDGTIAGSSIVKSFPTGVFPQRFYSFNDKLFFNASGINVSDGTEAGTIKLLEGQMMAGAIYKGKFVGLAINGNVYSSFLFSSDGTVAGTEILLDLSDKYAFSLPYYLPILNDKLIIPLYNDAKGIELTVIDGFQGNPYLLKDIAAGEKNSNPTHLQVVNTKLYFLADDGVLGKEIWISDGTDAGTRLLKDCDTGTESANYPDATLLNVNSSLLFIADEKLIGPKNLWRSDGTTAGTVMEHDFEGFPSYFGMMDGDAIFFDSRKLYRSNGMPNGTSLFMDLSNTLGQNYTVGFNGMVKLNEKHIFYFSTSSDNISLGGELWTTDGTTTGTQVIKDINPGRASGVNSVSGAIVGNKYLFAADDGALGSELWITDGTSDGTEIVKDLRTGPLGSRPASFTIFKGEAYFAADDGINGPALWKSNGTADGTTIIKAFASPSNPLPWYFTVIGEQMIFSAFDQNNGWTVWRTDGTAVNTIMIKDINPESDRNNTLLHFTAAGDLVYFSGDDGVHGREVWVTNGDANGTHMIELIPGLQSAMPTFFTHVQGDAVYFSAAGKLWKTNGTALYTSIASDVEPYSKLIFKDGWIFYHGISKDYGLELFKVEHTDFVTGVEEQGKVGFSLFPNPVSTTLCLHSDLNEEVKVSVTDLLGVVHASFMLSPNATTMQDVGSLSSGLYLVTIKGKRSYQAEKFLKK